MQIVESNRRKFDSASEAIRSDPFILTLTLSNSNVKIHRSIEHLIISCDSRKVKLASSLTIRRIQSSSVQLIDNLN